MPLYGHELSESRNAAETGFTRPLADDKAYIGAEAIRAARPPRQMLVGLRLHGRRAARDGDVVCGGDGEAVGLVTSGAFGPSVGCAVALGYVDRERACDRAELTIRTRRAELAATVCDPPFYSGGTARKDVREFL